MTGDDEKAQAELRQGVELVAQLTQAYIALWPGEPVPSASEMLKRIAAEAFHARG